MSVMRPNEPAASRLEPSYSASYVPTQRHDDVEVTAPATTGRGRHFIVCGDSSLAFRLVEELAMRYRADVTAILADPDSGHGPAIARMNRVQVVRAAQPDAAAFRAARLHAAEAVALVARNDVANVYAALQAQELNPNIRLVLRVHSPTLGQKVEALFTDAQVLSDVDIAAPAFVGASMGVVEATVIRIGDRVAHVTTRADSAGHRTLCGLAVTAGPDAPVLLPEHEEDADLVLALDDPGAAEPYSPLIAKRHTFARLYRNINGIVFGSTARPLVSRSLLVALAFLAGVVLVGIGLFWVTDRGKVSNPAEAAYLMLFTSVGAGNADLTLSAWSQVVQTIVTVAGVAMIPLLSAAIVQASVHARIAFPHGALVAPDRDHVVVVGLGNLGTRVVQTLHERGVEVVAIDQSPDPFGISYVRDNRIHFIVGDGSRQNTLERANVSRARALVVMTADDVVNLEYALRGRELRENIRVVLRLFDGDFADRIKRIFNITVSRSVSFLAAPAFAAGMVGREVIGTIGVRRRVLLVADVPVQAGSWLEGRRIHEVYEPGEARVVALFNDGVPDGDWRPGGHRLLTADDRLIVIATRLGLSRVLGRSARNGHHN
jgi:Trk K+ transport system NAD-binding subunit